METKNLERQIKFTSAIDVNDGRQQRKTRSYWKGNAANIKILEALMILFRHSLGTFL